MGATMRITNGAASGAARSRARRGGRRVVAEILEDGTVRTMGGPGEASVGRIDRHPWGAGSVSGDGWVLWWERRQWWDGAEPASASAART